MATISENETIELKTTKNLTVFIPQYILRTVLKVLKVHSVLFDSQPKKLSKYGKLRTYDNISTDITLYLLKINKLVLLTPSIHIIVN